MSSSERRPGPPPPGATSRSGRVADAPRRVRHGIRLAKDPEVLREQEYARRWLDVLQPVIDETAWQEGLEYARSGQTVRLAIAASQVEAAVQGRAAQPYETRLSVPAFSTEQWSRLIAELAADAGVVAKLLTGAVPPGLLELSEQVGMALLPLGMAVDAECSCTARRPCKHAAAIAYLVAHRLLEEPLTVFDLRGMAHTRLLDRLRQVRAIQSYGAASAHADPLIPESQSPAPALESAVEDYWRAGPQLSVLTRRPPAEYASQALLRRLGPSPLPGKFPLVGLLASIYDAVADHALRVRDHAEQIEEEEEGIEATRHQGIE